MASYREAKRETAEKAKPYGGFTHDGRWFTSETPVRGALTEFVRRAINMRAQGRSPCDVILSLAVEPPEVRAAFVPVAAQWSTLTRGGDWYAAFTTSSAHEAIKRQGRGA